MKTATPYLLIFRDPDPAALDALSPEQRQQLLEQWNAWYERLSGQGKVDLGRPLEPTGRVVRWVSGRVTDGPFVEAKEAIGGFFLLKVSGLDEATEIARMCPGLRYGIDVEVRPVASSCALGEGPRERTEEPTLAKSR
jgi:hypothetical protein